MHRQPTGAGGPSRSAGWIKLKRAADHCRVTKAPTKTTNAAARIAASHTMTSVKLTPPGPTTIGYAAALLDMHGRDRRMYAHLMSA